MTKLKENLFSPISDISNLINDDLVSAKKEKGKENNIIKKTLLGLMYALILFSMYIVFNLYTQYSVTNVGPESIKIKNDYDNLIYIPENNAQNIKIQGKVYKALLNEVDTYKLVDVNGVGYFLEAKDLDLSLVIGQEVEVLGQKTENRVEDLDVIKVDLLNLK